jgi:diguanylate cyclase (GGDEF)-like protein
VTERNFTNRFDVAYPVGRFDMSLNLIDGNPIMYRFFDCQVYFSIYKLLDEEEQTKVSAIAKICLDNPGVTKEECIHIKTDNAVNCYVITMSKIENEDAYYIEFINATETKDILNQLNNRIMVARDVLTLFGQAVFAYTPDTNNFHMFIINRSQNIQLFDMDFDDWTSLVAQKKLIADDDIEAFEAFCYILKNATVSQTCKFHGRLLTDQNIQEKYKISFMPQTYPNGETVVLGTWAIISEHTDDVKDNAFDAAYVDSLTGLLNKKAIMRYAEMAVENAPKKGNQVSLAIMDIDNFKGVNDNYGHLFGDKVIKAVGEIIKEAVGTDAVAGRMGGDEFLIVFEKFTDELEYRNVLRCIKTKVNYVYQNKFTDANMLTCSIGLSRYGIGSCSTSFHDLFKIADRSLYLAKQKGKNRYIIYKPELHGEFVSPNDNGDIVNMTTNYYSEKDIDKFHALMSDTVIYGSEIINSLIEQLSQIIMFDRLGVFLHGKEVPDFEVAAAFVKDHAYSSPDIINDKHYLSIFNKNKIVISNIHGIEYTLPDIYSKLSEAGISSMMQYLLTDREGNIVGYISGEVFDHFAAFPKLAIQLFDVAGKTINSVLIREGKI